MSSNLVNVGISPAVAMGMVYNQGAHSIGLLMQNAVLNEKLAQVTSRASVEQCLVMILSTGAAGAAKGQ